jgi:hypothetical protein
MTYRLFAFSSLLCALLAPATASAQYEDPSSVPPPSEPYSDSDVYVPPPPPSESHSHSKEDGTGARLCLSLNWFTNFDHKRQRFFSGNIPTVDVDVPIGGRWLQLEIGARGVWGFSEFYMKEMFPMLGLRLYPFGSILSMYGKGGWGMFFFNDSTVRAEAGAALDIPIGGDSDSTVFLAPTAGYYYERSWKLGKYIKPEWWHLTSPGWIIGLEFVVRKLD